MQLCDTSNISRASIPISTLPHQVLSGSAFHASKNRNVSCTSFSALKKSRSCVFVTRSISRDGSTPFDVQFPSDYSELLRQAKKATELAVIDNKQLMFVTEKSANRRSNFQLLDLNLYQFFPEANEVEFARKSVFGGASFKLDYLTKPSLFEDFGFVTKVKMADRVKPQDEMFMVAYPYFNVNEMLVVEELYKEAVEKTSRKMIIFNGELDRIRTGYYPPFFYPKLAALTKTFLPKLETVYYIHNFKGWNGGALFRCYPGPWKVLRKLRGKYVCLHQQEVMPSLKEVALDILPSA